MNNGYGSAFFLVLLLSGCSVSSDEWELAEKVCANNGGVEWVVTDGQVRCKNGAFFRDPEKATPKHRAAVGMNYLRPVRNRFARRKSSSAARLTVFFKSRTVSGRYGSGLSSRYFKTSSATTAANMRDNAIQKMNTRNIVSGSIGPHYTRCIAPVSRQQDSST